jgi:hypothetical protein
MPDHLAIGSRDRAVAVPLHDTMDNASRVQILMSR